MLNVRTAIVALVGVIIGVVSVLFVQRIQKHREVVPSPPPALLAIPADAPSSPAPLEEPRIRLNACRDLHSYVCSGRKHKDPTGTVHRDAEGEVETLRIYEDIIRKNPKLSITEVDELLVKRIYTPGRTKRVREIFAAARDRLIGFLGHQPFQGFAPEVKETLRKRVEDVVLDLPPPASNYADEPDLFTRNDVFYEHTTANTSRIRIGGALLFTVQSRFNLAFTLAHELAHSIDPCELHAAGIDITPYRPVIECLGNSAPIEQQCSAQGQLAERFADWAATHVVVEILEQMETRYDPNQLRSALFNTVRDLCQDDEEMPSGPELGLAASHPRNSERVNDIFGQHPKIREILGCSDAKALPEGAAQCFWLMGPGALDPKETKR